MKAIIICGPTGAGKSSMALNLAKKFKGVIINADSVQIYREIKFFQVDQPQMITDKLRIAYMG